MKIFKRIIITVLAALCFCGSLAGCSDSNKISFYLPDGAPLLATHGFSESERAKHGMQNVELEMVTGAQIGALITAGTPDVAAAPINLCAKSVSDTNGEYVLAGVSAWGLMNIVGREEISSLSELVGEIIYAFQKTGTPGLTLKSAIQMSGLEYIEIENDTDKDPDKINIMYLASPVMVRTALMDGLEGKSAEHYKFGLLAEPIATQAEIMSQGAVTKILNMNDVWQELTGKSFPQVGILVRRSLAQDAVFMQNLLGALKASTDAINETPLAATNTVLGSFSSQELPSAQTISAFIESSQGEAINFVAAENAKAEVVAYLQKLIDMGGAALVGGQLPPDSFYYGA